ncbi:MAG TPA: hypothetical protein VGK96_28605 [Candidatus Sulfotelmatobacter sp.]
MSYGSNPEGKKFKAPAPTKTGSSEWVRPVYLDISLSDAQRDALAVFITEMEYVDLFAWVGEKCAQGHAVEVKQEDEHIYARITGIPGSEHAGLCLTARASTAEKAMYSLAYRDIVILSGGWPTKSTRVLDA